MLVVVVVGSSVEVVVGADVFVVTDVDVLGVVIVSVVDVDSMVVLIVDIVVGSAAAVLSVVTVEDNIMSYGLVAAGLVWVLLDMVL